MIRMVERTMDVILLIISIIFITLFSSFYFFFPEYTITGQVTSDIAQGGNVTELNISIDVGNPLYWQGFVGQVVVDPNSNSVPSAVAQGGNLTNLTLTFSCHGSEIYGSFHNSINFNNLVAGNETDIDTFLGVAGTHSESGSSVLSQLDSFEVNGTNITDVPSTFTQVDSSPGDTTFNLGLLNDSTKLILVTSIANSSNGYDGGLYDYQIMLPVNQTHVGYSTLTYYFFTDCSATAAVSSACGLSPVNFSASVLSTDNKSINLSWNSVSQADNYTVYYSNNISSIVLLNTSNVHESITQVQGIIDTNWTDDSAHTSPQRYYKVAAVTNGCANVSDKELAKYMFQYTVPSSYAYGPLASNRISIYINTSYYAESFLQEIPSYLNPTISRLDKNDASGEFFTSHVGGLADGNNFTLDLEVGYQVTVDAAYNHTIVGEIVKTPYNLSYDAPYSTTYGTLATNWRGVYDFNKSYYAESFLQEIPASLNPSISRLDKNDASGEFLTSHVRGLSDGNNFSVNIGVGYAITVDESFNHTLCMGCFS